MPEMKDSGNMVDITIIAACAASFKRTPMRRPAERPLKPWITQRVSVNRKLKGSSKGEEPREQP